MEIRDGFSLRASIRAGWLLAALGCVSLNAHSQSDWGNKIWWNASGTQWVPDFNKSAAFQGMPATPPASGALVVNGAGIVHGPAEWPKGRASSAIPGLAKSAPIDVVARFKPSSVAGAFGRLASRVGPLSTVLALATFAAEVGFTLKDNPGGSPLIFGAPAPGDGLLFMWQGQTYGWPYESGSAACNRLAPLLETPMKFLPNYSNSGNPQVGNYQCQRANGLGGLYQLNWITNPTPPTGTPSTAQEFADAVAAKSGWPTSSAIAPAIAEALRSGEVIQTETPVVSGPASSPVSKSTTNNPNGSTTTKTTTNNYTYNGPNVKVSTVTITNTFNPATGATDTTTETTEEEPELPPTEEPKDQCELTPDALGCAELDEPTEEIPRDTENIDYEAEDVFGDGSCPANLTANIATLGASFTVWDWAKTCEYALPLRFMVVGLASFAALLIVMPGGSNQT